jgi:hypothetical protein
MTESPMSALEHAYPPGLTPQYASAVNAPIALYEGPATLLVDGESLNTDVLIRFNLLHPQGPEVVCAALVRALDAATELKVPNEGLVASIRGRQFQVGDAGCGFVALLRGDVETGTRSGMHRILFHIANMPSVLGAWVTQGERASRARISLNDGTWQVNIDSVSEAFGARNLTDRINDVGGLAITHVGELRRVGGGSFNADDGQAVLRDVGRTLSFARAGWSLPFLLEGSDAAGNPIWRSWSSMRTTPFCRTAPWFSSFEPEILNTIFAGWRRMIVTPQGETISAALHLYLDAQEQGLAMESRLVLAQAALEGLADGWPHPPPAGTPSVAALNGEAAKRIASVGLSLGLDLEVPPVLTHLAALAKPSATSTVFEKMAWVRNSVAHLSNFPRLSGVDWRAKYEAAQFALWVLELALLRLLDADGRIRNRLTSSTQDHIEKLPWKQ